MTFRQRSSVLSALPPPLDRGARSLPLLFSPSFFTCDICGRKLISFRLIVCGRRLLSRWQSRTPSRRVCARSNTCADSHVTRWFAGSTLQFMSHSAHCRQYSIILERGSLSGVGRRRWKFRGWLGGRGFSRVVAVLAAHAESIPVRAGKPRDKSRTSAASREKKVDRSADDAPA